MQKHGLVKRKRKTKNVRRMSNEEQSSSSNHAKDSFEIDELRRICREQSERAPEMRTDELVCAKEEPSPVNQLFSQIRTLQDNVCAVNEEKDFNDPESARCSGISHVPRQPSIIPSPRGMISRNSGFPHHTRNSMGSSVNVF